VVKALGRHVQFSVTRSGAGVQTSPRARPPNKEIISNNPYAHGEQGDNPGHEKEGSTVFSINCDGC